MTSVWATHKVSAYRKQNIPGFVGASLVGAPR